MSEEVVASTAACIAIIFLASILVQLSVVGTLAAVGIVLAVALLFGRG